MNYTQKIKEAPQKEAIKIIVAILELLKTADNNFNNNEENLVLIASIIYSRAKDDRDFNWLKDIVEDIITGMYDDGNLYLRINSQTIFKVISGRIEKYKQSPTEEEIKKHLKENG